VAWGGAIWGCLIPLLVWAVVRHAAPKYAYLAAFFAGFCLIANGAYLAAGAFVLAGDAGDLLTHGAARWQLICFGVVASATGLCLWNGLGPQFGWGVSAQSVDRKAAVIIALALSLLLAAEITWG
jgi:hypothetical protein